jgi:selenocysteine-specific elongation factor
MITRNFILATAGHVDHGKSSLVKALTGIDPDRLPEEKARGITIDLGFAHLELTGKSGSDVIRYDLGIVDVPGHEDFVKNMVAGVGSIDLALLIVAADDGWMPQTEEHLQILSYLGVTRAVVALTKIDLAEDPQLAQSEIRERLQNSPFATAPIVPTSIHSGRGLSELKEALVEILNSTPAPRDIGKPRLSVDRVFVLRGIGTVVTGTGTGGIIRRGAEIIVQTSGSRGRIRSVQNHSRDVELSGPGTRTALNIPDIKGKPIQRGDVITTLNLGEGSSQLDVLLEKSARLFQLKTPAARPLKDGARIRMHIGSRDIPAHVVLFGNKTLEPGATSLAHLRLEAPVYAFAGDRFIIRDWSEQTTLCGGIVLDPDPPAEQVHSPARLEFLGARAASPHDLPTLILTQMRRVRAMRGADLLARSRFSSEEIAAAFRKLVAEKRVIQSGEWSIDRGWWESLRALVTERIDEEHRVHPNRAGLSLTEMKSIFEKELPTAELFQALIRELPGYSISGSVIKRTTHRLALPLNLQMAGAKVRAALSAKPFDPPSRKEIAPDAASQQALNFLIESGEATLLSEDVAILSEAFQRATGIILSFLREKKTATASELRQALNTSRRVIIPLLEKLDQEGFTRRDGDKRMAG